MRIFDLPRQFDGPKRVAFVINSMSVWRVEALRRIGPFNEGLAIDHVDTEYCLRARELTLAVYVHGGHEFAHSIGQRRRFRFLGRDMQAGGHSAARRYLITLHHAGYAATDGRSYWLHDFGLRPVVGGMVDVDAAREHFQDLFSGFGAELAALVQERCFYKLEAPIQRVTGYDTPYPHSLEWEYFPTPPRIIKAMRTVIES